MAIAAYCCWFGVKEWWRREPTHYFIGYEGRLYLSELDWQWVTWELDPADASIFQLEVGEYGGRCRVYDDNKHRLIDAAPTSLPYRRICWMIDAAPRYHQQMAVALYRLGIEDDIMLAELNHPLSAHEKLELRLSMPREFWP